MKVSPFQPQRFVQVDDKRDNLTQLDGMFGLLNSATAQLRARYATVELRLQVPPYFAQEC